MALANVMIVEDEAIIAKDIEKSLEDLGYAVTAAAASGKEAIKKVAETRPDVVLMDIVLRGGMDGIEAAEIIRTRFHVPVVYLTAHADENTIQRAKITEPYGYILKPFEERALHTAIQMTLYKHKAETQFREDGQRLSAITKSLGDAVIATDLDEAITFMNPIAEALTGWRQEEALGKPLAEVFHVVSEPTRHPIESPAQKALQEGAVVGMANHTILINKDKTETTIENSVAPIRDDSGNVTGAVLVFHDSAERKRLEDELRQRIEELTVNNHTKDEFLAALSHELRTPLSSVLGWARVLRSGNLDKATAARALETIERNAKLQARLIEDTLDVSRIIMGKLHLNIRLVELASIIKSAVDAMRPMAEVRGVRLDAVLDSKAGTISGDPDRLHQVVWNLLSHAIKSTPQDGRVEVRIEATEDQVQIKVTNTGQGISAEALPHVFDRFRKGVDLDQEPLGGLGLGLSIARHLVELHGGTIQAESPGPGMGSTFTVNLPRKAARSEASALTVADDALLHSPTALNGLSVLVVDDEAEARDFITTVLEQRGARAIAVSSAAEAMEVLKRTRPDVLISDIRMPDEDGYDLIRKVRTLESESGGRIPAVALTGYARFEDRMRVLSAGYQMHVAKPVEPTELAAVVASLTGRTGQANRTADA
jgi:PAS domain S-box-containing protein